MDDPNMNAAFIREETMISLDDWVQERLDNCLRIADTKTDNSDRMGWLEDATYFKAIQFALKELDALKNKGVIVLEQGTSTPTATEEG